MIFQHNNGTLAVWLMNGVNLAAASLFNPNHPGDPNWRVVGTGDFDRDGNTDLVFQHTDGTLAAWFLDGITLARSSLFTPSKPDSLAWRVVSTVDRNGDSKPDLLFQHNRDGSLAIWFMNGTELVSARLTEPPNPGSTWKVVAPK